MIAHFVLAGQSNIDQWFAVGGGSALEEFRQTFLTLNPEYSDVQFFDAARGGSALLASSAAQYSDKRAPDDPALNARIKDNYWFDESTQSGGPNLLLFADRLKAEADAGTEFLGVIWAQGEADTTYVGPDETQTYADGLDFVLAALMEASGAPKVYIQALGDRAVYSESLHAGTDLIRTAQQSVADASDDIVVATTIFDLDLRDTTHLTEEGYVSAAARMATAISTGFNAPGVGEAVLLSPSVLLVQLDLTVEQSASQSVSAAGFTLFDNGEEVPIVSLTLSPAGLLRIEAGDDLIAPVLTYASAKDSVDMEAGDYIYVSRPHGANAVLPFTVTATASRNAITERESGLVVEGTDKSEVLAGLSGSDTIIGSSGHDTIDGGWGADELLGGAGSDTFVMGSDAALDVVRDYQIDRDSVGFHGFSTQDISFGTTTSGDLVVRGPSGQQIALEGLGIDDGSQIILKMLGTNADNLLIGHSGDDRIYGLDGDDTIDVQAGTDRIWVGEGSDTVVFGSGYDTNVVYDFSVIDDKIELADLARSDLTFQIYKETDLEIRTPDGDRLVLRNVDFASVDALQVLDAPPQSVSIEGTENADVLRGTTLNEVFEGYAGTDRIYTGGGDDSIVFRQGSGLNVVYDFDLESDRILVDAADAETLDILAYKETDAEVRLTTGDRLVLRNTDPEDLLSAEVLLTLPDDFG